MKRGLLDRALLRVMWWSLRLPHSFRWGRLREIQMAYLFGDEHVTLLHLLGLKDYPR